MIFAHVSMAFMLTPSQPSAMYSMLASMVLPKNILAPLDSILMSTKEYVTGHSIPKEQTATPVSIVEASLLYHCQSLDYYLELTIDHPIFTKTIHCFTLDHESNTVNGFTCPEVKASDLGVSDPHPKYADPDDCAKFYICLNGISPRAQGCELGLVYNTITRQCDSPENVAEW